jgi:hypothetical protein
MTTAGADGDADTSDGGRTLESPRRPLPRIKSGVAGAAERDQFIPVRKADLLDALIEHGLLAEEKERARFRRVCRALTDIQHHDYFGRLERLRHDYFYFDPELDPHARFDRAAAEAAYADLVASLTGVLAGANFVELPHAEIERAHRERKAMRVAVEAPIEDFRDIRFFRRGHHTETIEIAEWLGLRKRPHDVTVYDDVVLFVALKPVAEIASKRERKRLAERKIRPGSVLIKYFRNIAATDLKALFPNVRVVMSTLDKMVLSLPALAGAIPILLNLASTVTVLFLVAGFYLGIVAVVEHEQMKGAFAAMSALVALVGFVMRQYLRYQRQSLKYQKELTDNIYFRNVNNNAGIFDYIIGAAEEQECKEAFLAYYFLRTGKAMPTQAELDARIESFLAQRFGVEVAFKVGDALANLDRLGLLARDGERLSVPAPDAALARLEQVWDGFFQTDVAQPADAGE